MMCWCSLADSAVAYLEEPLSMGKHRFLPSFDSAQFGKVKNVWMKQALKYSIYESSHFMMRARHRWGSSFFRRGLSSKIKKFVNLR